ncbi:MAG: LrgB family protein, partial [Oscillospiraceae bacterium]|nr:LrgB family protein [Oscillospiraceae bacterium]
MNDFLQFSTYFGFLVSIGAYLLGDWINRKLPKPVCNPMLFAVVLIIAALKLLRIDFETYNQSAKYLSYFIT